MRRVAFVALAILAGCAKKEPPVDISRLSEDFVHTTLAFSPVSATAVGYHVHEGRRLDEALDDFSPASLDEQRKFYNEFRALAETLRKQGLAGDAAADLDIIDNQTSLSLLELDTIQSYRHNPTLYVELIGSALYSPYVLEYAAKPERYRHIIARMEKIPTLLDQAKANLADAPEIWNTVAREENDGNLALIETTLREAAPQELRERFDRAAAVAVPALRAFNEYLKTELAKRTSDWRLGKEKYDRKFRHVLMLDQNPEQVLVDAEVYLKQVREEMKTLSVKLGKSQRGSLNQVVSAALANIAGKHATPATYFQDARRDLAEAQEFVRTKNLLPLPERGNLQVIETPEFMRGIYAVGGFNPAPVLEPNLGAFYWITPIPKDWKPDRVESKLREYNYYGLKLLTIHEAMPGHYVQSEYANNVQPESRRMLRGVSWNGPYVEGWAVYATGMMLDEGYLNHSAELRLTFLKQQLRMIANAILDVRLQTMGMTDEQAMNLMLQDTFQEREEAVAKLRRAKLSSCQLPTYFAGWREWVRLRDEYRKAAGDKFRLFEFHERALKTGPVPMPVLARALLDR